MPKKSPFCMPLGWSENIHKWRKKTSRRWQRFHFGGAYQQWAFFGKKSEEETHMSTELQIPYYFILLFAFRRIGHNPYNPRIGHMDWVPGPYSPWNQNLDLRVSLLGMLLGTRDFWIPPPPGGSNSHKGETLQHLNSNGEGKMKI